LELERLKFDRVSVVVMLWLAIGKGAMESVCMMKG